MKRIIYSFFVLSIVLSSCNDKNQRSLLPNVTGKSGEVVLVIEPDMWASETGEAFRKALSQELPALPQSEPVLDLVHIPYSAFTNIFKTHRNLVFAKVDKKLHEPKVLVQKDMWAKPQIVIQVMAPDAGSLAKLVNEKGDLLVDRILKREMERYAGNYKKYQQRGMADILEKKFGIRLTVPQGYSLDLDTTNFAWIESRGRGDAVQGLLIYEYDQPEVELTTDYLIAKRNEFTKKYVPGPNKGSYMAVEREVDTYRREIKVGGLEVIELRGLWKVENDFMGGPFLSFVIKDNENNRIIALDGFVYAPQFDKRDYLRQLEAILNSVQVP